MCEFHVINSASVCEFQVINSASVWVSCDQFSICVCVRVCVRACVRACVRVCEFQVINSASVWVSCQWKMVRMYQFSVKHQHIILKAMYTLIAPESFISRRL